MEVIVQGAGRAWLLPRRVRGVVVVVALVASLVALVAQASIPAASAGPTGELGPLEDLGGLPGGTGAGAAVDVNEAGQVVGRTDLGGRQVGFRWDPGVGMVQVGPTTGAVEAEGINDLGDVVGDRGNGGRGGWLQDGTTGAVAPLPMDHVEAVNDGRVVVGATTAIHPNYGVEVWVATIHDAVVDSTRYWGTSYAYLVDLNDAGDAAGAFTIEESCPGFCTRDEAMVADVTVDPPTSWRPDALPLGNGWYSAARGIASDGAVVGSTSRASSAFESLPYLRDEGGLHLLWQRSDITAIRPTDVNASSVVVGTGRQDGHDRAVVWYPGRATPFDLGTLGGDGSRAHAVSDAGVVVGEAQDASGVWRPFRLALPELGTVTGTVTDADGAPVAGAIVQAYDADDGWIGSARATTAADGTYALANVAPGAIRVLAVAPPGAGLVARWHGGVDDRSTAPAVAVGPGSPVTGVDVVLPPGGTVGGTLTDESGAPVAGALVALFQPTSFWPQRAFVTATDGSWGADDVRPGTYRVLFRPPDERTAAEWWDDAGSWRTATPVEVVAGSPVTGLDAELTVVTTGALAGYVTSSWMSPLPGAVITAYPDGSTAAAATTTSGADGAWRIEGLEPGGYQVRVDPPAGAPLFGEWFNGAADQGTAYTAQVTAGTTRTLSAVGLAPDPSRWGGLSGTVTDPDGAPLGGVAVHVFRSSGGFTPTASTTTAADGTWTLVGLEPRDYQVLFAPDGITLADEWYDDEPDRTDATWVSSPWDAVVTGIDAQLEPVLDLVAGRVTGPGGVPVAGATVALFDADDGLVASRTITTSSDGSYALHSVPAGAYRVQFRAPTGSGLVTEWWDDAATRSAGAWITVPGANPSLDAELAAA